MKLTPSQVKNLMRRGLRFLLDPDPEPHERQRVIIFFGDTCAYCGVAIETGKGDLDHLVPSAQGGRNHISNRVLSCKPCNAEEKRDKHWEDFLEEKSKSRAILKARRQRILSWIEEVGPVPPLSEATLLLIDEQAKKATLAYDEACKAVRGAELV